jgi:hypothetical protein
MAKSYVKILLKIVYAVYEFSHIRLALPVINKHVLTPTIYLLTPDADILSGGYPCHAQVCGFAKFCRYPCFPLALAIGFLGFRK